MGVKHAREYADILTELTEAVGAIDNSYEFFDMSREDWVALDEGERKEVMEALADDVFYGLGEQEMIQVGSGVITHRPKFHVIEVAVDGTEVRIVRLI